MPNGDVVGAIGRKCTADYKIKPIHKFIRKHCNIKHGQKNVTVTEWIGISWDEIQRAKESRLKFMQKRYPLLETKINRSGCINWMYDHGYPVPPRRRVISAHSTTIQSGAGCAMKTQCIFKRLLILTKG